MKHKNLFMALILSSVLFGCDPTEIGRKFEGPSCDRIAVLAEAKLVAYLISKNHKIEVQTRKRNIFENYMVEKTGKSMSELAVEIEREAEARANYAKNEKPRSKEGYGIIYLSSQFVGDVRNELAAPQEWVNQPSQGTEDVLELELVSTEQERIEIEDSVTAEERHLAISLFSKGANYLKAYAVCKEFLAGNLR